MCLHLYISLFRVRVTSSLNRLLRLVQVRSISFSVRSVWITVLSGITVSSQVSLLPLRSLRTAVLYLCLTLRISERQVLNQ
nr:MAG TPA: hypothetical protein [Caudoviricetes sp.]